jgi:hypothetical protein
MPSLTFIGDVHGWSDRLERVLAQADGYLVFIGDLIDRGPDAPGVLRRVRQLCESNQAACVMGNHEYAVVRGLGVPELGIPGDPQLLAAWADRYGGQAVLDSYGVKRNELPSLRQALGDDLLWMAKLPWILEGEYDDQHWLAVHAGFNATSFSAQCESLRQPMNWLCNPQSDLPMALYAKSRAFTVPEDQPKNCVLISGHTPIASAYLRPQRILCDTTGGLPNRKLTGVIWPERKVIQG